MSADRELLEMAAKSAEIDGFWVDAGINTGSNASPVIWNPFTDDGDALKLAVKLGLVVCVMREPGFTGVYLPAERIGGKYDEVQHHGKDHYAATRRAIVRAAAEIGRGMK